MSQERFPLQVKRGSSVVTIYPDKRAAGTYYRLVYYFGGKRMRASFPSLGAAKGEAEKIASLLSRGEIDAAQLTGKDRLIYGRAAEIIRPFGVPLDAIALDYREAREALGGVSLKSCVEFFLRHNADLLASISLSDAIGEFLADKRRQGLSKVYLDDLALRLRGLQRAFGGNLGDLRREGLFQWMATQRCAPRTFNNLHRALKTFFSYAQNCQALLNWPTSQPSSCRNERCPMIKPSSVPPDSGMKPIGPSPSSGEKCKTRTSATCSPPLSSKRQQTISVSYRV